jgi:hypothetical protein
MIGFFPTPYPNELVYSVCARFANRMQFPTVTGTMEALFGRPHAVAIVDLPHGLEVLASSLPPGHPATVDGLIDSHTLFAYYGPFLQTTTYNGVRESMKGYLDRSVRVRCGLSTSRVRPPGHFRTCPACSAENRKTYGETYWNRLFQLSGMEVCPKHNIFLQASNLRLSPLTNRHQFISAESSTLNSVTTSIDPKKMSHQILLGLAKATDWLLQQPGLNPGLEVIHRRYLELLRARGFVTTQGGSIRMRDLRRELETYFTPQLLALLHSTIPDIDAAGWLGRLLHKPKTASAPLRHLLLLNFLQTTPQTFFAEVPANRPAHGSPPEAWLCVNPVCAQHRKFVITSYSVERIKKRKADAALFACPACGFTYGCYAWTQRVQKPDFIRCYGQQWMDRLKALWLDVSVSVRHISNVLGVDSKTVKSHAQALGLPFPRKGKRTATACGIYRRKLVQPRLTREPQRQEWLDLRAANRGDGPKRLRCLAPRLYAWLYRHDRAWLRANQPARRTRVARRSRVDWKKRDEELAPLAVTTAIRLKHGTGRLQRVTVTAIARAMGRQSLFEKNLHRLLLTRTVIRDVIESAEDFAIRRILQSASQLRWQLGNFERWQLVKAAGLRPAIEKLPRVRSALDYELIRTLAE